MDELTMAVETVATDNTTEVANPLNVKTQDLTASDMDEVIEQVKSYEDNPDNFEDIVTLGAKLLEQKGTIRMTRAEKRKIFQEKGIPVGSDVTINENDEDYVKYLELEASFLSGNHGGLVQFITTTVDTVEYTEDYSNVFLICLYGSFQVKIPVTEYMWIEGLQGSKNTNISVNELYNYAVARIGSKCTFKVEAILPSEGVAYASRIKALGITGFANYVAQRDRSGSIVSNGGTPRYTEGSVVKATVVCAMPSFVIVEAEGAEFRINDEELSWGGIQNANDYYQIGDTFFVKILAVGHELVAMPTGQKYMKVNVVASKRLTEKNPILKYKGFYREGTTTSAFVTAITDMGMRLTLGTPEKPTLTTAYCAYPLFLTSDKRPKVGDQVNVTIARVNVETGRIRVNFNNVTKRKG